MIDGEYQPNPKLQILYRELELLNSNLRKQSLDDRTRLQRMRSFAQASLGSNWRIETFGAAESTSANLAGTALNPRGGRWIAKIKVDQQYVYLGTHDTAEQAHEAYRRKHIEVHGEKSPYHPDNPDNVGKIDDELFEYARSLGMRDEELIDA